MNKNITHSREDIGFLNEVIEKPIKVIEMALGVADESKVDLFKMFGRLFQAARSGHANYQLLKEIRRLQENGKICTNDEIQSHPYAMKSLSDLLMIIDSNVEDDRLEAIKAMFFLLVSADRDSKRDALKYRLFQITTQLSSSQLVTLKTIDVLSKELDSDLKEVNTGNANLNARTWFTRLAEKQGHNFRELIESDAVVLAEHLLISKKVLDGPSVHYKNFRLTNLGEAILQALEEYKGMIVDIS